MRANKSFLYILLILAAVAVILTIALKPGAVQEKTTHEMADRQTAYTAFADPAYELPEEVRFAGKLFL